MPSAFDWIHRLADKHPTIAKPFRKPGLALRHAVDHRRKKSTQRFFANLSTLLVEDPCIEVAEFKGKFYLDARSAIFRRIVADKYYEPELTALCAEHCDRSLDVLDIGANVGFHSVLFSRLLQEAGNRKVLSVEPTHNAFERLKKNLLLNELSGGVIAIKGAVSNEPGEIVIQTVEGMEEFSSVGSLVHPTVSNEKVNRETVRAYTIDALVSEHQLTPGFMKIDVEGAEGQVLAGARQTLAEHRPIILAELSDPLLRQSGSSSAEVLELLRQYDYQITDPLRPDSTPGGREYGDILCIPS